MIMTEKKLKTILAQSSDLADLENRMKELDRRGKSLQQILYLI